jgi:hypothetical protein
MRSLRIAVAAAIAGIAVMGAATPLADAQVIPTAPCSYVQVPTGPAGNPGTAPIQVCQGAGLSFVGPVIGQLGSVVGPTTIGPAVIGVTAAAAGNVGVGP